MRKLFAFALLLCFSTPTCANPPLRAWRSALPMKKPSPCPAYFSGLSNNLNPGGQRVWGLSKSLSSSGSSKAGSANESTWYIESRIPPTNSAASYQKNAVFAWCITADQSQYAPSTINRDCVGLTGFGKSNIANGRNWGGNFSASNAPGDPSLQTGVEIDVSENNAIQTLGSTFSSSTGVLIASLGSFPVTSAALIGGSNSFHDGFVAQASSISSSGSAFSLWDLYGVGGNRYWSVAPTGLMVINDTKGGAPTPFQFGAASNFNLISFGAYAGLGGGASHEIRAGNSTFPTMTFNMPTSGSFAFSLNNSPVVEVSNIGIVTPSVVSRAFAIASLPNCNSNNVGMYATVNNGVASPTYFGAVGDTGRATDPVFCSYNGSMYAWVYH